MGVRILLALVVLIGLMWIFAVYGKAAPAKRKKMLNQMVIYGGVGVLLLLVVTGRLPWLFALVGAAIPMVQRLLTMGHLYQNVRNSRLFDGFQSTAGRKPSRVETQFLDMTLDLNSGEMDGEIRQGTFQGSSLNSLDLEPLLSLFAEYSNLDQQSAALLEAYLDRRFGDQWRQQAGATENRSSTAPAAGNLSPQQAAQILGIAVDADEKSITRAHRQLIAKMHPDRGGSDYLAALINKAKEVLLAQRD